MKIHLRISLAALLLINFAACSTIERPASSSASASCCSTIAEPSASKADIRALFDQWNASLATGNPGAVADLYASDAVLLPTLSNKIRHTRAERIDYFEHFLVKKPRGVIDQENVRIYGNIAINSGLYTFTFEDGTKAHARYTFVYREQPDGKWLIVEHHSSLLPEPKKK